MLSFDIRDIETRAAQVDGRLVADDPIWQESDLRPSNAVHATGRLSSAGGGRFYWNGHIAGELSLDCRRCLEPVDVGVSEDVHVFFADPGEEAAEDPDVYRLDTRRPDLDLRPAVREQWVLSAPAFALCREDCKGLCPSCGADLNAGSCECPPVTDGRWDALRSVRTDAR